MTRLNDLTAATRLARAILVDIKLYNAEKFQTSTRVAQELSAEFDEGRQLFHSRVEAALHAVYESELTALVGPLETSSTPDAMPQVETQPPVAESNRVIPFRDIPMAPRNRSPDDEGRRNARIAAGVLIVALIAIVAFWIFFPNDI